MEKFINNKIWFRVVSPTNVSPHMYAHVFYVFFLNSANVTFQSELLVMILQVLSKHVWIVVRLATNIALIILFFRLHRKRGRKERNIIYALLADRWWIRITHVNSHMCFQVRSRWTREIALQTMDVGKILTPPFVFIRLFRIAHSISANIIFGISFRGVSMSRYVLLNK